MIKHIIRYFLLFLSSIISLPLLAKDGNGHVEDMHDVFPFESYLDLYYKITSYLDEPDWVVNGSLAKKPHFVNTDTYYSTLNFGPHRIWFHWGLSKYSKWTLNSFDISDKSLAYSHRPLQARLRENDVSQEEQDRFWDMLYQEEQDRLKDIFDNPDHQKSASSQLGYSGALYDLQQEQIFALVNIMYCIHLLGDHTTTDYGRIRSEEDIRKDIEKSINVLAGFNNQHKAKKLIEYLNQEAPISRYARGTLDCSSQKYLDALKNIENGFSHFLLSCDGFGYEYRTRFKDAGITIRKEFR